MRTILGIAMTSLLLHAAPALAKPGHRPAPSPSPKADVIPLPEIRIELPDARFEHAIVRDNEEPVVLLLV